MIFLIGIVHGHDRSRPAKLRENGEFVSALERKS
jgi:hypothetical protein